ncbi:MAG: PDZ domain-containing protein [Alphaproteobacteria bacterium]|jgi:serine protease Do|nr:PDZ domain-containing protein [Alphaproteobacteria bacterium]
MMGFSLLTMIAGIGRRGAPALLLGLVLGACSGAPGGGTGNGDGAVPPPVTPSFRAALPNSFADVVDLVTPAVVNIAATGAVERTLADLGPSPFPPGSPLDEFFERFREQYAEEPDEPLERTSQGSGFLIDPNGVIVTNFHVIAGARNIVVTLHDGTERPARVVGTDPRTDLALLRVTTPGRTLPYLEFGNSDDVRVGDWVIAIGNPFGLGGTVTAGIVSARGRDIAAGPYDDYLQIDAAINRGSSGGPTFDASGRVIGINSAIFSPSGGNIGIGFAIPSNLAEPVVAELRQRGFVERGWLGVRIQEISPALAERRGLPDSKGALVVEVEPGSPAARAGLRPGDVVRRFDGRPVETIRQLTRMVGDTMIGREVILEVWRDGRRLSLDVSIGAVPPPDQQARGTPRRPAG